VHHFRRLADMFLMVKAFWFALLFVIAFDLGVMFAASRIWPFLFYWPW
jgi:hypothetical protein